MNEIQKEPIGSLQKIRGNVFADKPELLPLCGIIIDNG
jgi:hypothetical protein